MNFQAEVIEQSHKTPVVVDFWAPWCGPCRVLGPTIEALAEEQSDRWKLVKVNTEEEQTVAAEYQIRSIPNVKMFYKGRVIAEFAGALPRTQIENWLANTLPDGRKETLDLILERLDGDGDLSELEAFVAQYPDMKDARLALAMALAITAPERAEHLLEPIKAGAPAADQAVAVRTIAELMQHQADDSASGKAVAAAQAALKQRDWETGIKAIIEATGKDKSYAKDLPRRAAIACFHAWGNEHPLTKVYRRQFDMVLY
ncbi:MAG: thioredoxin [Phaeodactylibacter sp.]|uniref:thioredoxin n=1 Tax=Phaeodactylibacter sp. TaxID=1940289 RepID=UPI0032ED37E6